MIIASIHLTDAALSKHMKENSYLRLLSAWKHLGIDPRLNNR
jgi:hypothetical protein